MEHSVCLMCERGNAGKFQSGHVLFFFFWCESVLE